jgi:hypothetical protein
MPNGFRVYKTFAAISVFVSKASVLVRILYHAQELERLKKWAKRRRLQGVFAHYCWLHQVCTTQLVIYRRYAPISYELAYFLHTMATQLAPRPAFYSKGAAAKYRLRN